jgi:hypothetical protein
VNRFPIAILAATTLLLGGCQAVFDLVGVEKPLSALEARNFDGSYQGDISQIAQGGTGCSSENGEKVIMVGDGVLWYAYSPTQLFTAPVRFDGTISAISGVTTLAGRISGNHLAMTIQSPTCQTSISMNFIYNHS